MSYSGFMRQKRKLLQGGEHLFPSIVFYIYRKRSHYCRRGGTWWHHQPEEKSHRKQLLLLWHVSGHLTSRILLSKAINAELGYWWALNIYFLHIWRSYIMSSIPGKGLYTNWFIIGFKWILLWCISTQPLNSGVFYFAFIFLFIYNLLLQKDFPKQVILQKDLNWAD